MGDFKAVHWFALAAAVCLAFAMSAGTSVFVVRRSRARVAQGGPTGGCGCRKKRRAADAQLAAAG